MVNTAKLTSRLMNVRDKAKVFHTSGYATAQNGGNFGAASTESFSARQAIDENRRFVQRYNNARIIGDARALERVRTYVPRTDGGGRGAAAGRSETLGGTQRLGRPAARASAQPAATPPARRAAPIRLK